MVRTCALWKETNQKVSWARFDQCLGSSVGRAQALDLLESACEMQRSPVRIRPKTLLPVQKSKIFNSDLFLGPNIGVNKK